MEVVVLVAFVWGEILLLLLPPLPAPTFFLEAMVSQAFFALAALHVTLSRRLSWRSIGLSRTNLYPSLALGALYTLLVVVAGQIAVSLGFFDPGTMIGGQPSRMMGPVLAFLLYLPFWGIFESVWMCYLVYAVNRWLKGGDMPGWSTLLLAALCFGLMHAFTQVVAFGAPLPQALGSLAIGLVLFVPGTIIKLTGNAWGLVLWFTVTNFGTPDLFG